jgi:hypothetical protein
MVIAAPARLRTGRLMRSLRLIFSRRPIAAAQRVIA